MIIGVHISTDLTKLTGNFYFMLFIMVSVFIITLIQQLLNFQACFAAGQSFFKNKLLGSFVAYIISYYAMQLILSIPFLILVVRNQGFESMKNSFDINPLLITGYLFSLLFAVTYLLIAKYLLSRKLNLA